MNTTAPAHRATRLLLAAACACTAGLAQAQTDIQPTANTPGVNIDLPSAGVTNINAPDNAIIDYDKFDVGAGDTVNFIQPGASSRVLNRINSNTPSQIDGTVNANGIVYFVNPAGVTFGPTSVVDAAGIFAAAGSISDADFISQNDFFDNVAGDVTNHGIVRADTIAAFVGQSVTNTGTIAVPNGTVVMAAGSDVYIGNTLGGLRVQVNAGPINDGGGVNQNGTVNAKRTALMTGDLASLAMDREEETLPPPVAVLPEDTDLNGDCVVDEQDVDLLLANIALDLDNPTKADGDFDGDGDVDFIDLQYIVRHFGYTCPPQNPNQNPSVADAFALDEVIPVQELPVIAQEILLGEAGLQVLLNQLGIAPRPLFASERLSKAQASALYNDLAARAQGQPLPEGALPVASVRLDPDVVRRVLQVYRDRIAAEGVPPNERIAQIRIAVEAAYRQFTSDGKAFDADAFARSIRQNNPGLFDDLAALNELRELTRIMGLNEAEKINSDRRIVESTQPEGMTFEQMKATLQASGSVS